MPRIIRITNIGELDKVPKTLNRISQILPEMTRGVMRRWGNVLARDMKDSARIAKIGNFENVLQTTGIRWEQKKRANIGFLFMRLYGIYLDSMKPHFVSVHRRRTRLLRWALQARVGHIRRKARLVAAGKSKRFGLFVRPHPFIAMGYRRARPKLRPLLKQAVARAIKV